LHVRNRAVRRRTGLAPAIGSRRDERCDRARRRLLDARRTGGVRRRAMGLPCLDKRTPATRLRVGGAVTGHWAHLSDPGYAIISTCTRVGPGLIPLAYRMSWLSIQAAIPTKLANRMATLPNEMNPIRISKIRWPIDSTAPPETSIVNWYGCGFNEDWVGLQQSPGRGW
jgi:hypothetical protein